jgi:hypothetical protein
MQNAIAKAKVAKAAEVQAVALESLAGDVKEILRRLAAIEAYLNMHNSPMSKAGKAEKPKAISDPTTPPSTTKPIISLEHSVVQSPKF